VSVSYRWLDLHKKGKSILQRIYTTHNGGLTSRQFVDCGVITKMTAYVIHPDYRTSKVGRFKNQQEAKRAIEDAWRDLPVPPAPVVSR
jgi:hypothetical protein